jgi:ATP adenylyltransferase
LDRIWAPWRIKYVQNDKKNEGDCVFCRIYKEKEDRKNYVIKRSSHCFSVLNLFPYNNGHLMVVANRHLSSLEQLQQKELLDFFLQAKELTSLLKRAMKPAGFNVGINIGDEAGAGVADHLHLHVVPRWAGDTNFMPAISKTKVIPQGLDDTYQQLIKCLQEKK